MEVVSTVVFDFDSTLITRESLDDLIARVRPEAADEVSAITRAGMDGRIPFVESVRRRLAVARPTRAQAEAYGEEAVGLITPGMDGLLRDLDEAVWIVSGGLVEALLPVAAHLRVDATRVVGTRADWAPDGSLRGLLECGEKADLLRGRTGDWDRPRVMVGDGMSDYAVARDGLVDRFVAFTGNVRRAPVVATGAPEARTVAELRYLLEA